LSNNLTIWITGTSGFIGYRLYKSLLDEKLNIIQISLNFKNLIFNNWNDEKLKVQNYLDQRLKINNKPDIIIHLGWGKMIDPWSHYHIKENVNKSIELFKFAKINQVKKIIFCGSMNEYADVSGPIHELTKTNKTNKIVTNYAKGKLKVTNYGLDLFNNSFTQFYVVRPSYVYGPGQKKSSLISQLFEAYRKSTSLDLTSCNSYRDYIYVDDVVHLFKLIILHNPKDKGIYNVGSGKCITVKYFVNTIWKTLNADPNKLKFNALEDRKEHPQPPSYYDNVKLKLNFKWVPTRTLSQGINQMANEILKIQ